MDAKPNNCESANICRTHPLNPPKTALCELVNPEQDSSNQYSTKSKSVIEGISRTYTHAFAFGNCQNESPPVVDVVKVKKSS